jgi:hypothetical protein
MRNMELGREREREREKGQKLVVNRKRDGYEDMNRKCERERERERERWIENNMIVRE